MSTKLCDSKEDALSVPLSTQGHRRENGIIYLPHLSQPSITEAHMALQRSHLCDKYKIKKYLKKSLGWEFGENSK